MRGGERCGDHHEAAVGEPRDADVRFDSTTSVEKLRVADLADRHAAVGGGDDIERTLGIASLHEDLRKRGLLEKSNRLAHRAMLLCIVLEPVLSSPGVLVGRPLTGLCVPVGSLPPGRLAEAGTGRSNAIVQHAALDAARGAPLAEWPMVLVADA